jgi:ketosteroid isomerase-like protein
MHPALSRFVDLYRRDLAGVDMAIIADVYSPDVEFIDPAHNIHGCNALIKYFNNMMQPLTFCQFDIRDIHELEGSATLAWTMTIAHPKLRRGKPISIEGMTLVRFDKKIDFHRDYFDLGAMLYEHIPLIGRAIKWLKRGLAD